VPEVEPRKKPRASKRAPRRALIDSVLLAMDVVFALAAGALSTLATSYTGLWWLQIVCVAGLAWRVSRAAAWRAAVLGWAFGAAWVAAGTWWLYISMHLYGGLSSVLAVLAVAALSAFLALYLGAAMALFATMRRNRPVLDSLLFGACWLLAELARGVLLTGFPWAASGYAHIDGPLATLAPWIGVYGIGFVGAALSAGLVLGMRTSEVLGARAVIGALVSLAVLLTLGSIRPSSYTRPTGTLQVTLLQSNVPQDQKFVLEQLPQTLAWAATQLNAAKGDLVVGPETVVPLLPDQLPNDYWQALLKRFQRGEQAALFGRPLGSFEAGYTNSAIGISRGTAAQPGGFYRYDKHHLVPFGEFIPSGFRWFTELMNIPLGDFNRGPRKAPSFVVKGERVAPNICYEDLFGEELAARFTDLSTSPTIFANLSNIGWFGDTIALKQHLNISRMRTIEFQRPMLRSTNTGTTAVIDHTGRVTHELPVLTQGVLNAEVQGRDGMTPYAWWVSSYQLWPLLALSVLLVLVMIPLRRQD
jgi:apolipoprotein N-acyltransferase